MGVRTGMSSVSLTCSFRDLEKKGLDSRSEQGEGVDSVRKKDDHPLALLFDVSLIRYPKFAQQSEKDFPSRAARFPNACISLNSDGW